jgi:hypothetical protein
VAGKEHGVSKQRVVGGLSISKGLFEEAQIENRDTVEVPE